MSIRTFRLVVSMFSLGFLLFAGCSKPSDEAAIRSTISDVNRAYEAKDLDRFTSFFAQSYFDKWERRIPGGKEQWKERIRNTVFSHYNRISIASTIDAVEKTPTGYIVRETVTMKGVDSTGREKLISSKTRRASTFAKGEKDWEITDMRWLNIPASYDSLKTTYPGMGEAGFAYVSHATLNYLSVIDTKTDKVVGIIPCGEGSVSVAFAEMKGLGYTADFGANTITVFNKGTNEESAKIDVGAHPSSILVGPDEELIFVAHESAAGLWVISAKTNQVVRKFPGEYGVLCWSGKERKIYQSQISRPDVAAIDPSQNYAIERIEVGGRPLGIALTPDESSAYVANVFSDEVEKIDTHTKKVVKRIAPVYNPRGIAIDAEGKIACVTNVMSSKLTLVDLSTDTVIDSLAIGRMPTTVSICNANHCAYISNQGASSITVFDLTTRKIKDTIAVADNPISVVVDNGKMMTRNVTAGK